MTENNPIRLFVTHLFEPDESYFRVFEYLESQPNFFYTNLATPEKPPRSKEKEALREDLRRQMTDAEVVILLSTLSSPPPCRASGPRLTRKRFATQTKPHSGRPGLRALAWRM